MLSPERIARALRNGENVGAGGEIVAGDHALTPGLRPRASLRPAAVLVPLIARRPEVTVLLTRRTPHLAEHAGQISFPGGQTERADRDAVETALRETQEEVGLARERIEIIARLPTYVTGTGFSITPVVGLARPPLALRLDTYEVAEAFEVPLRFILEPANHQRHRRLVGGQVREFYALPYGERFIWGATAGILVNLARRLRAALEETC